MDLRDRALLDQVTSGSLERGLASAPVGASGIVPARPWRAPRSAVGGGRSIGRRVGILAARLALMGLALTSLGGLVLATARAVFDADGVSLVDVARLAVVAIVAASIVGQVRGILPRRVRVAAPAPPVAAPLVLDRTDDGTLLEQAPVDLGTVGLPSALLHRARRRLDTILWAIVAGATLLLIGSIGVRLATGLASDLSTRPADAGTALLAGFLVLVTGGWLLMARTLLGSLLDRRRRRRRSALLRLLRYLLQLLRDVALGTRPWLAAPSLAGIAVMVLAATIVAGMTLDPGLAAGPRSGAGLSGPSPSLAPTPTPGGGVSSAGPGPAASSTTGPGPAGSPTATVGATPAASATREPFGSPSASPSPSPNPSFALATAPPTATGAPTLPPKPSPTPPKPTASPSPTIDPTLDSDGDKVPDVIEILYGSKPNDGASTPEHKLYDAAYGKNTCGDKVDNDLDGGLDVDGNPPDKGCL